MNHYWRYCSMCERDTVICGKCGNNCCSGGYGEIDGVECDACPSAYALQELNDTFEAKLTRIATLLNDQGQYVKEAYCYEILDYISDLKKQVQDETLPLAI